VLVKRNQNVDNVVKVLVTKETLSWDDLSLLL